MLLKVRTGSGPSQTEPNKHLLVCARSVTGSWSNRRAWGTPVKTQLQLISTRTKAGDSAGQVASVPVSILYMANVWVRSGGRLGWSSLQHTLAGVRVRMQCRPVCVGKKFPSVHIRVWTRAGQAGQGYSTLWHEL